MSVCYEQVVVVIVRRLLWQRVCYTFSGDFVDGNVVDGFVRPGSMVFYGRIRMVKSNLVSIYSKK